MIDLSLLHNSSVSSIEIEDTYTIPESYYENSEILGLSPITITGKITYDEEEQDIMDCMIKGEMVLKDSISLEEVSYPFLIEYHDPIEENCKNSENLLDIFQFLWENIVLEVPLQFTKVSDLSKYRGDGWRLISEDELSNHNNPFTDLLKDFDKE